MLQLPSMSIDKELVKRIVKRRKAHKEWICTKHDACPCDGTDCIYPCTCFMKERMTMGDLS